MKWQWGGLGEEKDCGGHHAILSNPEGKKGRESLSIQCTRVSGNSSTGEDAVDDCVGILLLYVCVAWLFEADRPAF